MSTRTTRLTSLAAAGVAALLLVSGCSSDGTSTKTASGAGTSSDTSAAAASDTSGVLQTAYKGVTGTPPTTTSAAAGSKSVWVVSCGESIPTCARPAAAAADAAKAAGWTSKVCDGQINPQGWAACIRQGISAKSDGIIVVGSDCVTLQGALQEAKEAGIPTVAAGGADCDVTGGAPLFSAVVQNLPDMTAEQWWNKMGALQADWIVGKTNAKAKVLSLRFADGLFGPWIQEGFEKELASACPTCKIVGTVDVGNADVGSGQLPQKFSTALLQHPDANAVNVPLDGWFFAGLGQAITASGQTDQLAVIGNFAEPGNLDFIRKGAGQDASVAFAAPWVGWSGVDALIRLSNGGKPEPAGVGLQVVDKDNNMPAGPEFAYNPQSDFAAAYTKAWGKA